MVDRHAKLYSVFVAMDADGSGYVCYRHLLQLAAGLLLSPHGLLLSPSHIATLTGR